MKTFKELPLGTVIFLKSPSGFKFPVVKIEDEDNRTECSHCRTSVWNAHNLNNTIHVCPGTVVQTDQISPVRFQQI